MKGSELQQMTLETLLGIAGPQAMPRRTDFYFEQARDALVEQALQFIAAGGARFPTDWLAPGASIVRNPAGTLRLNRQPASPPDPPPTPRSPAVPVPS